MAGHWNSKGKVSWIRSRGVRHGSTVTVIPLWLDRSSWIAHFPTTVLESDSCGREV